MNFYPSLKTPWAHFIIITFIYYKYNRNSCLKLHKIIERWYIFDFPLNDLQEAIRLAVVLNPSPWDKYKHLPYYIKIINSKHC